jgi:hypothetical protein
MKKTSSISKVLILMLVTTFMISCGTPKNTIKAGGTDFAGNYEWYLTGTPDGDNNGIMILKKTEKGYTGEYKYDEGEESLAIEGIKVEGNKMTGSIDTDLGQIHMDIIFYERDHFKGEVSLMDESYPFTGNRVK